VGEAVATAAANDMTTAFDTAGWFRTCVRHSGWVVTGADTTTRADDAAARHDQSRRGDRAGATLHAALGREPTIT
jgi:hypothetical protein